jgi:hypothetical protein
MSSHFRMIAFQLAFEITFALFLFAAGLIHGSSTTEVVDNNSSSSNKPQTIEFTIALSRSGIELESDAGKQPYQSLTDVTKQIMKIYSLAPAKTYRVVLAPTADVFSQVPAWYRMARSHLSDKITVNVAIP